MGIKSSFHKNVNLGEQILKIRKRKNLSQDKLAEKIGVSRVAIGNYERGDRSPTAEVIVKLAKSLEVSADTLLGINHVEIDDLLSIEERILIKNYRLLDSRGKKTVNCSINRELIAKTEKK
ncbi:MAG: helix-turn-helix domain-containing protein [Proteocatella sp.]